MNINPEKVNTRQVWVEYLDDRVECYYHDKPAQPLIHEETPDSLHIVWRESRFTAIPLVNVRRWAVFLPGEHLHSCDEFRAWGAFI